MLILRYIRVSRIQNTGLYMYPPIYYTRLDQGIQDTEYRVIPVSSYMLILGYSRV